MSDTRRLVVTSVIVTGVVGAAGQLAQGNRPPLRMGVGLLVAGTILAIGADTIPELAGGFAVLMMTTSMLVYGGPLWAGINRSLSKGKGK